VRTRAHIVFISEYAREYILTSHPDRDQIDSINRASTNPIRSSGLGGAYEIRSAIFFIAASLHFIRLPPPLQKSLERQSVRIFNVKSFRVFNLLAERVDANVLMRNVIFINAAFATCLKIKFSS